MEVFPVTSLSYVHAHDPGIRRVRRGGGFSYISPKGKPVADKSTLARINALVLPPAWTDVWICTDPRGHLQATGLDAKGRRQYRYHADWTAHRNLSKFAGLSEFARVLPGVRRHIRRDLSLTGLPKEKVLACIVHLLDAVHIRIGNEEYARDNHSYGLTTMLDNHAAVHGADVRFRFRAKSGKMCDAAVHHPTVAKIVRRCQDLPGEELFAYLDERNKPRDVTSCDVNDYLREVTSLHTTAKDFRTWGGTVVAADTLVTDFAPPARERKLSEAETKRRALAALKAAATALNNTVATCRKFYVHPAVLHASGDRRLWAIHDRARSATTPRGLTHIERAVVVLVDKHG